VAFIIPLASLTDTTAITDLGWAPFVPAILLFIVGLIAQFFVGVVFTVFTYTTWHLAHAYLRDPNPQPYQA
jgi:hypothetical protein